MKSQVIQFMDLVYNNANDGTSHSWGRINSAMRSALKLTIGSGFKFLADDFAYVMANYRSDYWISDPEWMYAYAIAEGNKTAVASFEAWKRREPFIADDVSMGERHEYAHASGTRDKERLHVGAQFKWKGQRVTVTSFSKDGLSLTACSYKPNPEPATCSKCHRKEWGNNERKIDKRFTITREAIILDRAERKERALTMTELKTIAQLAGHETIVKELGVKSQKELDSLPLDTIKAVLKKHDPESAVFKKRQQRSPEIKWLEQRARELNLCKDVVAFINRFHDVQSAVAAIHGSGQTTEAEAALHHIFGRVVPLEASAIEAAVQSQIKQKETT